MGVAFLPGTWSSRGYALRRWSGATTGLHVWPALTDLMVGIAAVLLIVLVTGQARARADHEKLAAAEARLAKVQEAETRIRVAEEARQLAENRLAAVRRELEQAKDSYRVGRQLSEDLRQRLEAEDVKGVKVNAFGNLEIASDSLFDFGQSIISEAKEAAVVSIGRGILRMLADPTSASRIALISVVGHTDQAGLEDDNLRLSTERALALVRLWRAKAGVEGGFGGCAAAKLLVAGMGESRPLSSPETPVNCENRPEDTAGCRRNRRIEIRITPKDGTKSDWAPCN